MSSAANGRALLARTSQRTASDAASAASFQPENAAIIAGRCNDGSTLQRTVTTLTLGPVPGLTLASDHGIAQRPDALDLISTTSPSTSHRGGVRAAPTPAGVPVRMTSPGSSVQPWLIQAIRYGTENTSCEVFDDCSTSPLTRVSIASPPARSISSSDTSSGPSGQNVSNDFDQLH